MCLFRRNTHQPSGVYRSEIFDHLSNMQRQVWNRYGYIVHVLSSSLAMSYNDILDEIRKDTTNFSYRADDVNTYNASTLPDPKEIALGLIRCIEARFVEVVNG